MLSAQALTERNVETAQTIAESIHEFAVGVLLSGSNAWGADYAVHKQSDIDIAIIVNDCASVSTIVQQLVDLDFISTSQMKRANLFITTLCKNHADIFSLSETHNNHNISIDIIPKKIFDQIVNFLSQGEVICKGVALRTVKEFRSNPPKDAGYTVDNLKCMESFTYHPKFYAVGSDGYIAESLVDSIDDGYCMGVYSFFLAVEPKILVDTDSILKHAIQGFQKGISSKIGKSLVHITRQERMSLETFSRIQDTFSQ